MRTKWKDSIKSWKKEYNHIRSSMQCFFDIYVVHTVHAVKFVKVTRRSLDKVNDLRSYISQFFGNYRTFPRITLAAPSAGGF